MRHDDNDVYIIYTCMQKNSLYDSALYKHMTMYILFVGVYKAGKEK